MDPFTAGMATFQPNSVQMNKKYFFDDEVNVGWCKKSKNTLSIKNMHPNYISQKHVRALLTTFQRFESFQTRTAT